MILGGNDNVVFEKKTGMAGELRIESSENEAGIFKSYVVIFKIVDSVIFDCNPFIFLGFYKDVSETPHCIMMKRVR